MTATGLVSRVEMELRNFKNTEAVAGGPDYRALAVTIVRVFRDYIEAEIQMPDPYDTEEPSKGQG
jgi:hypothetical protein